MKKVLYGILLLLNALIILALTACANSTEFEGESVLEAKFSVAPSSIDIDLFCQYGVVNRHDKTFCYPPYQGNDWIEINRNQPTFCEEEKKLHCRSYYSNLDDLGRCGTAFMVVGKESLPISEREYIGMIKPSGWQTIRYDGLIEDHYLYNRCHLIGFQLGGANIEENLITGTRYMNIGAMLDYENLVAHYVKEFGGHVLYEVEPIFNDDDLVAYGVHMQAYSVEDHGESISFNVFIYNIQPGIQINYYDGSSNVEYAAF